MSSESDLTVLLGQAGWTRALARSLASDVHLAEDLAQDVWVAALERPPDLGRPVRGWLASVLRHRWLDLRRREVRSRERERTAAGRESEAWPSSHDVVEKASLQRELVEAVLELDEPYRTTVLLRFFEELPQREIARRMRTSTLTVNSRLTRALAKLREQLSRGGRRTWLQVLVPLLREPATVPAVALGAGAMKVGLAAVIVAASLVAGFVLWKTKGEHAPVAGAAPLASAAPSAELDGGARVQTPVEPPRARDELRVPLPADATPPAARVSPPPSAPLRTLRGRVLDVRGAALAGIALALSTPSSKTSCTSAAGGWFEIALDAPAEGIISADPEYATVLAGSARVHDATQPIVVVAPRIELAGVVLDEAHAPLAGASLELSLPAGFGSEWGVALDYSLPQRWRVLSGADGSFALPAAPAVEGAVISAALAGFAPHSEDEPLRATPSLEIVLARPGASSGLVHGVVLDPTGARVENARVSAGEEIALSGARGEFTLDVRADMFLGGTGARLIALKAGLLPALFEPTKDASGKLLWPAEIVLQLGGPAGTVSGRVLDDDGAPVAGAKVWVDDPTSFGHTADARMTVESLVRGDERFWSFECTGADGSFQLGGLLSRPYRLQAVDPRTLATAELAHVSAPDSGLELRLATHDVYERVAGRVVSGAGRPIAGVSVRLFRVTFELAHEGGVDNDSQDSEPVLTGADGAFVFRNVPRHGVEVLATGDTILGASADPAQESDPTAIELVASLRLHLQVELDEPHERADRLRVFDAGGKRVLLSSFHGAGAHADFEMPILDGRSGVLSVSESAATLVLYQGDVEVARLALHLVPGETNVVRH